MSKSILLISSGQPSLNPRLVKEADALADKGYNVTVLYAYWNDWGTEFDKQLIPSKKWKAICAGGDPLTNKGVFFLSRLIHKAAKTLNQKTGGKYFAEAAIARAAYFLSKEVKKHLADLYIGHNLGALPATVVAARANKKPCGFDAEDYHRNEVTDNVNDPDFIIKKKVEDRYLPYVDYLTASSPLIASKYKQLYPKKDPVTVLNVFPQNLVVQSPLINRDAPVKLFWFSQTIGPGRGIEDIISALVVLKDHPFELHLLGQFSEEIQNSFLNTITGLSSVKLYFHKPIAPDDIPVFASGFDAGIASENSIPLNRDICLPNKIFTYLQSGLALIASDTSAQVGFLQEHPGIGEVYQKKNVDSIVKVLLKYHQNRELLFETQKAALQLARQKLNWKTESQVFLETVEKTLNTN